METEAAAAGFYYSPTLQQLYPKVQIVTIEGLLSGAEQVRYPDLSSGALILKRAPKEQRVAEQVEVF